MLFSYFSSTSHKIFRLYQNVTQNKSLGFSKSLLKYKTLLQCRISPLNYVTFIEHYTFLGEHISSFFSQNSIIYLRCNFKLRDSLNINWNFQFSWDDCIPRKWLNNFDKENSARFRIQILNHLLLFYLNHVSGTFFFSFLFVHLPSLE